MPRKKTTINPISDPPGRSASRKKRIPEPPPKVEPEIKEEVRPLIQPITRPIPQPRPPAQPATVNINIKRMSEQKLLDSKLMRKKSRVASRVIYALVFLVILGAVGFFIYYRFYDNPEKTPVNDFSGDEIIVPDLPESEQEADSPDEEATPVVIQQVKILDTPTGYLNVRSGPGTNFEQIGRVNPGEIYDLVSEDLDAGWYQIRLDNGQNGWVIKQYSTLE